jgi:hypothetical protein
VSQSDLLRGALARALGYARHAQRKVLDSLSVKEVMTSEVITTSPDTLLVEAAPSFGEAEDGLPACGRGRTPRRYPYGERLCRHGRTRAIQLGARRGSAIGTTSCST